MTLSLVSAKRTRSKPMDANRLDQLQQEQFFHDENYHREIARLTVQKRLTHMALHFAKYAGYLAEDCDSAKENRVIVDILIIGISCANILNLRLSQTLNFEFVVDPSIESDFGRQLTIATGRMAAACEKLDHLEAFPYRSEIQESVVQIVQSALLLHAYRKSDVEALVRERLAGIRSKSLFNPKI